MQMMSWEQMTMAIYFVTQFQQATSPATIPHQLTHLVIMPLSMRRQAALEKSRAQRDQFNKEQRQKAVSMLRSGITPPNVRSITSLKQSKFYRLAKAVRNNDETTLRKMLAPEDNRGGRPVVITKEENVMLKDDIKIAAERGCGITHSKMMEVMGSIASDGRVGFRTESGLPSPWAIRGWRARNRDMTFRHPENKEVAKLRAECFSHVNSLVRALKNVAADYPGIFDSPSRLWNVDETKVSSEFGERQKVFGSANTHHGGSIASRVAGGGKHVTAVIAISAAGAIAPPFLIVAGKNKMSNWFDPLLETEVNQKSGGLQAVGLSWLKDPNWFPEDAHISMSDNGSMEKRLISFAVDHIARAARKSISPSDTFCLTLDGHSSREGWEWLENAKSHKCAVVQSPSDTTHFLQPCDQDVNKFYQKAVRKAREKLLRVTHLDLRSVRACLMLSIIAHYELSPATIRKSFEDVGLWPMNFSFIERFEQGSEKEEQALSNRLKNGSVASRIQAVAQRAKDADTHQSLLTLLQSNLPPSTFHLLERGWKTVVAASNCAPNPN